MPKTKKSKKIVLAEGSCLGAYGFHRSATLIREGKKTYVLFDVWGGNHLRGFRYREKRVAIDDPSDADLIASLIRAGLDKWDEDMMDRNVGILEDMILGIDPFS